jgi:hypothetical protein
VRAHNPPQLARDKAHRHELAILFYCLTLFRANVDPNQLRYHSSNYLNPKNKNLSCSMVQAPSVLSSLLVDWSRCDLKATRICVNLKYIVLPLYIRELT